MPPVWKGQWGTEDGIACKEYYRMAREQSLEQVSGTNAQQCFRMGNAAPCWRGLGLGQELRPHEELRAGRKAGNESTQGQFELTLGMWVVLLWHRTCQYHLYG
jgi:hypothetical protein